ncbi:hypothetical protein AAKU55_005937, partial [Oxalobacteraceae bacterium GrIS 1.11]
MLVFISRSIKAQSSVSNSSIINSSSSRARWSSSADVRIDATGSLSFIQRVIERMRASGNGGIMIFLLLVFRLVRCVLCCHIGPHQAQHGIGIDARDGRFAVGSL